MIQIEIDPRKEQDNRIKNRKIEKLEHKRNQASDRLKDIGQKRQQIALTTQELTLYNYHIVNSARNFSRKKFGMK